MRPWFIRFYRIVEVVLAGMFVALAAVFASVGRAHDPNHGFGPAIGALSMAVFTVALVELRFWTWRRALARIQSALEAIASKDLESHEPAGPRSMDEVVEAYAAAHPSAAIGQALARSAARNSVRLCVMGRFRGRDVEIGTVITPGRGRDTKVSYLCVRDRDVRRPFGAMTRGAAASIASMFAHGQPVSTGDAAFDERWIVGGDESIVRAALDATTRAKLLELGTHVPWLRAASLQTMPYGLVVRWPGLLSSDGAAFLRDLALDLHARVVAHAA